MHNRRAGPASRRGTACGDRHHRAADQHPPARAQPAREQANRVKCLSNLRQLGPRWSCTPTRTRASSPWLPRGALRVEDWIYWQYRPVGPQPANATKPRVARPPDARRARSQNGALSATSAARSWRRRTAAPATTSRGTTEILGGGGIYKYSYSLNENFEGPQGEGLADQELVGEGRARRGGRTVDQRRLVEPRAGRRRPQRPARPAPIRHDRERIKPDPRNQILKTHPNGGRRGNVAFVDGHAEYVTRAEAHALASTQVTP